MALRGKKPEAIQKRLKALFYGEAGVGKTTAAIQFPKPYLIDSEHGYENDQYISFLKKAGGVAFHTTDFDDVVLEVTSLLSEKHEYKTLIIDPFTIIYKSLCDKWAVKLAKASKDPHSDGTEFQRHRDKADKQVEHLIRLLYRLDMNVIITAHQKVKWGKSGDQLIELGNTFDCYKKLDYIFDLVFEVQKRGKEPVGIIKKTRVESFQHGETFPFSYPEIANRYGRDVLERSAVAESLASKEQVARLRELVELYKEPEENQQKWLDKANAASFEEMNETVINKLIAYMEDKPKFKREAA